MYDELTKEDIQLIIDYLYYKDVVNKEQYPNPKINLIETEEDSIVLISIHCNRNTTAYIGDIKDYFIWKRKIKLLKIIQNVQKTTLR